MAPPSQAPKRPWYRLKRTWFIGVPVLLFILMNPVGGGAGSTPTAATPPAVAGTAVKQSAPPEVLNVTADQLLDALEANALKASETYLNKRVRIEGRLSNVDASGKYFSLSRSDDSFTFKRIRLYIEPEHRETVMHFTADQTVAATGTISDVDDSFGYTIQVESIG
ncbi:hypothetical protein G7070_01445 [Propioniciclava coleopterorum]|uniref:tRNA_anti-like n=1 Tax=Propioniciclava coleopterorum TaxID=2714937 RepID=A0A6G7Y304_9ACTN|nr:hypothetical protein [Propioniciclava coleopterorum]QIK71195.1 hypothetical protein G7070_01445 [Propioniciclava coleopterorum]